MTTTLPAPFPAPEQRYLPRDFDPTDEPTLLAVFKELRTRPVAEVDELLAWIADVDELESALDAADAHAAIAATRNTEDVAAREAHLDMQTRVRPLARRHLDSLDRKYLACEARASLERSRWGVYDRLRSNRASLYSKANLPLLAEEAELSQRHDERVGALSVPFRGGSYTPQAMARWLDDPDRQAREEAWQALATARLGAADDLNGLFDRLLALRREVADNAGFTDYREYCFRDRERFDYGPADCESFHAAVEEQVVPAMIELRERRRRALGLPHLRPWDLAVDPLLRPPLRPFQDADELADLCERILTCVDPTVGEQFAFLRSRGLLDLANRPGKAPGGYQRTLADVRLPFIFANAVGIQQDVRTLLHEAGHAVHALAARDQPVADYRHAPPEFCEVASMSMELLGAEQFAGNYPPEDARRAHAEQLERSLAILPWVATIDAFQHWLYSYPEHTPDERAAYWVSLRRRFEPDVDWSGHEDWLALEWQRQLHLFKYPFYYIEYGIAQVGALQVWLNWRNKGAPALKAWRGALALGGSRPLPELFTAAHVCFDFGPGMLSTLTRAVLDAIGPR
jgi:oligoendopeptidase F